MSILLNFTAKQTVVSHDTNSNYEKTSFIGQNKQNNI